MCLPSPFPLLSVLFFNCGFDQEDKWDFRALEPSRCCMSLMPLKTGTTNHLQLATSKTSLVPEEARGAYHWFARM
ncbi:hypothetical protein F5051DRAFT_414850 [Lentinula edodes]|nr:hypothetical protein F5051DRAFT_414850 [Lentinula edodes]